MYKVQPMGTQVQQTSKAVSFTNQQQSGEDFLPGRFSCRLVAVYTGAAIAGWLAFSEGVHQSLQLYYSLSFDSRERSYGIVAAVLCSAVGACVAARVGAVVVNQVCNLTEPLFGRICSVLSSNEQQVNFSSSSSPEEKQKNVYYDLIEVIKACSSSPEEFEGRLEEITLASLMHSGNNSEGNTTGDKGVDIEGVNEGDKEIVNEGDKEEDVTEDVLEDVTEGFNEGVKEDDDDVELSQSANPGSNDLSYSVEDLAGSNSPIESEELKEKDKDV